MVTRQTTEIPPRMYTIPLIMVRTSISTTRCNGTNQLRDPSSDSRISGWWFSIRSEYRGRVKTCSSSRCPLFLHTLICVYYKVVHYFSLNNFSSFSHLNSTQHNLVIELYRALKTIQFLNGYLVNLRIVFCILNYWLFSKIQNSIFIAQESSQYWGII